MMTVRCLMQIKSRRMVMGDYLFMMTFFWLCLSQVVIGGNTLVARELLKTISPNSKPPTLPPGFPSLDSISTEKFRYKTNGNNLVVTANLGDDHTVTLFPGQVTVSDIKLKFWYDKKEKGDWNVATKGVWKMESIKLDLEISPNGTFTSSKIKRISLDEIAKYFYKGDAKEIGVETANVEMQDCVVTGTVDGEQDKLDVSFSGQFPESKGVGETDFKIIISKNGDQPLKVYTIMDFKNTEPEKLLNRIMNKKTMEIPFFKHLVSSSSLFKEKKELFGITISYEEVYFFRDNSTSSSLLEAVLQSHIPVGVAVLFPVSADAKKKKNADKSVVKLAFVINRPVFDLLIDEKSRMSVNDVLPILSKEFTTSERRDKLPKFMKDLHDAYTTHVSFDSSVSQFYVFVKLKVIVELVPKLLRIQVTNLVLHKDVKELGSKESDWKVSAKGTYNIGDSKFDVQYTELDSSDEENQFGLTGHADDMTLNDILEQFNPKFYPNEESKLMIENTEIETLKMHDIKLFSRVQSKDGTPHILLTGLANLPQWEKNIQVALLVLRTGGHWDIKWAMSFKHSPLTNIIEALTGFKSQEIPFLHNGHIMTTLISSPMEDMAKLPPHIITTPLLRLPVKQGLTLISLIKFPDNCGDDKMCEAASELLDVNKVYTTKGTLSTNEFRLSAEIMDDLQLSDQLKGVNNTMRFTIGNTSRMDILTSIELPRSRLVFDGPIHVYEAGQTKLQMSSRSSKWVAPFGMRTISINDLKFVADYEEGTSLQKLNLKGVVNLGLQGNGAEIKAPIHLLYDTITQSHSTFYANLTDISIKRLLEAFTMDVALPEVLEASTFPTGLMLTYSGKHRLTSEFSLHGELEIFGRSLYCAVSLSHSGSIKIVTENSPAPVIYARGLIIVQESRKSKLRGPKIVAKITHKEAKVTMKGFVKLLGMESDAEIQLKDDGIKFQVEGKLMDYKDTKLTAVSGSTPDTFKVSGCIPDVTSEVQILLVETITRSANQSVLNMQKAEDNFLNARKFYTFADEEEGRRRNKRNRARMEYEDALVEYGRYDVLTKDTCTKEQCNFKCFGCPKLNRCCRLDIFGHCIACAVWKSCCWKNIDPLCIAKQDGCHVIKAQAEKELAAKEARIVQQRILLDNLEQMLTNGEVEKGKHKAVLEAAIDAKQIVEEDSTPGLNAHDAIRIFGVPYDWVKINSICYNTSLVQAATGCMEFNLNIDAFNRGPKDIKIWSCLKEDLITEITESLANYIFPNMIDTTTDSVTEVSTKLNEAEANIPAPVLEELNGGELTPNKIQKQPEVLITPANVSVPIDNTDYGSQIDASVDMPYPNLVFYPTNSSLQPVPKLPNNVTSTPVQQPQMKPGDLAPAPQLPVMPTKSPAADIPYQPKQPQILPIQPEPDQDQENETSGVAPVYSGSGVEISGEGTNASGEDYVIISGDDDDGQKTSSGDDQENTEKFVANKTYSGSTNTVEKPATDNTLPNFQYPLYNNTATYPYVLPIQQYRQQQQQQQQLRQRTNYQSVQQTANKQYYNKQNNNKVNKPAPVTQSNQVTPKTSKYLKSEPSKGRRTRRSIDDVLKSSATNKNKNILFSNPFWDIHMDHGTMVQLRSEIARPKLYHNTLNNMINKRWLIPDNSGGRCHIFHQLMAICKDMADTIIALDKSLKDAKAKYFVEDKNVYLELFKTEEDLVTATKRVNVSGSIAMEAGKTLGVVRQGVNIWSKRCTNEFDWQKQSGVYAWLQAMDLRIQELGGYGVFRFLDNLFNAFQALFDTSGRNKLSTDYAIIERTRRISEAFHKVFKQKLDVSASREFANDILDELIEMRKTKVDFCR